MPASPDTDLAGLATSSTDLIDKFGGRVGKTEEIPVAFGLKSLNLTFIMDEEKGDTEVVEEQITALEGVQSVQVIECRRALG